MLRASELNRSAVLALPTSLRVIGDFIVVIDAASDSALHVFDRRTGEHVRSLGRRGKGPGEFYGAWSLESGLDSAPGVWVYDLPLRRMTEVSLAHVPDRVVAGAMVRMADGAVLTEPFWLTPDTIVTLGFFRDSRLALFDRSGHRIGGLGSPAPEVAPNQPMQASQARLARHPAQPVLAVANRYVSRIEFIDLATGSTQSVSGPVSVNTDRHPVEMDRFAYVDVSAMADRVVALFSGRTTPEFGEDAVFGDRLHVFDWRGTFEGAFRLDADVLAIAMDQDGAFVYALRHEPVPAVVRFRLPRPEEHRLAMLH
jgi:hypothetical protein